MPDLNYASLLDTAVEAATAAGRLIYDRAGTDFAVSMKDEGAYNLVTEMDIAAEALTQKIIRDRCGADALFLAEESGGNHDLRQLTWVIDPIDGTVNYAHGIPIYCVSVAAVHDNQPVAGAIYNPNNGELFTATKDGGVFLNSRRLAVSTSKDLQGSVLVTGFPYNVAENPYDCIGTFVDLIRMGIPVRRLGSAALDMAYVAAGRFNAFWEVQLSEWDVAAGALLITEAGGRIGTYAPDIQPVALQTNRLLASNGHIHDALLKVLAR